ncbi:aromatic ring-hydroxylating oxygenase subunit alpha [Ramlibacter sp. AN1133]|uniref:aromatic ring-hydroxylating oxygenase subunit alpha n=1 Tax=Ramlibacter sp. AN1133 TaxID=3133429 RepID=UPI0030C1EF57
MSTRDKHETRPVAEMLVHSPTDFRVDGAIYTDQALFAAEMDRIFGTTWVYVAHESEVPQAGDYKTTQIGLRPVIVSRASDGRIHVMLNRCRHRAGAVCRESQGNTKLFTCKYHGWTYRVDGSLNAISMRAGGYPSGVDASSLGLQQVARVESYRGFIFASMALVGPSLTEHLAPVLPYLDHQIDHSPVGRISVQRGTHRALYQGNWKFQAENSTDGYHGNFVHQSFWKIMGRFGNEGGQHGNYAETDMAKIMQRREEGRTLGFANGHGILEYPLPGGGLDAMRRGPHAHYMQLMDGAYTPERLLKIMPQYNLWIFPNLGVLLDQIRVVQPLAVDRTEVTLQFYDLDGVPEAYNQERFDGYERFFGPASFGSPDDVEMFAMNQVGLQAGEMQWLRLDRGLQREQILPDGTRQGHPSDETPQRAFHRKWFELMAAANASHACETSTKEACA